MSLSPYPNFCKTEKKRSQPTRLKFFSIYLTHRLCHIERVCKIILFLIEGEWFSPIIVSNFSLQSSQFLRIVA